MTLPPMARLAPLHRAVAGRSDRYVRIVELLLAGGASHRR
jgi:hypothetical protein